MPASKLPWTCPGCGDSRPSSRRTCACGFDAELFSRLALEIAVAARELPVAAIPLLIELSLFTGSPATRSLSGAAGGFRLARHLRAGN